MDMSEVILISVKKQRRKNICSTRRQVCKIIYSYSCELVIIWEGAVHKGSWYDRTILTDRAKAGGMIAYLLTDRALGTASSHIVSIDLFPITEAGVMLS
jgi:hypothetical protein